MLFPLLAGGSDPAEGSYFAFFPFGGHVKGLFAQDEIDFALFPLYLRMEESGRQSHHVLWPVVNWVDGAGWSGWKIWPFYSRYAWDLPDGTPRSRRLAIAWPFYIETQDWLHDDPTYRFFTFPFYGKRENRRSLTETYLWPFYTIHLDKRTEKSTAGWYLFPYRSAEGQFDLWPFWGLKETTRGTRESERREYYRQFALFPIQRHEWSRDDRDETSRFWLLPFFWRTSNHDRLGERSKLEWKLWPFCGYRWEHGETAVDVLSPLWFHREDWDRMYGRLFALYRYRARADSTAWELLYGTLFWRHTTSGESLFSVLGGLFECGSRDDKLVLRFLYIPWW